MFCLNILSCIFLLHFPQPDMTRGFLYLGSGLCYDSQPQISTEVNMIECMNKAYVTYSETIGWDSIAKTCYLTQQCDRDHLVGSSTTATTSTYVLLGQLFWKIFTSYNVVQQFNIVDILRQSFADRCLNELNTRFPFRHAIEFEPHGSQPCGGKPIT